MISITLFLTGGCKIAVIYDLFTTNRSFWLAKDTRSFGVTFGHKLYLSHTVFKSFYRDNAPITKKTKNIRVPSSVSTHVTSVNQTFKASKYSINIIILKVPSHSVSHCNQKQLLLQSVGSNPESEAVGRVTVLPRKESPHLRPQIVAFTESSGVVFTHGSVAPLRAQFSFLRGLPERVTGSFVLESSPLFFVFL